MAPLRVGFSKGVVIAIMRGRGLRTRRIGFVSVDFIAGHLGPVRDGGLMDGSEDHVENRIEEKPNGDADMA
jgi:hypothetical protein